MHIWEALYNPMTEESSARTLSIHYTKEGAEKVIEQSRAEAIKEHASMVERWKDKDGSWIGSYDDFKWWGISEVEVKP